MTYQENMRMKKIVATLLPKLLTAHLTASSIVRYTAILSVLMLMGCASSMPLSTAQPPVPASLMQQCTPLTPLTKTSGAALVQKIIEIAGQYHDCADSKAALVNAVM